MSELDMSQYLDLFLQEANEQLEILEQETVKLEGDPSIERLQTIFRSAHTLKGSSRAMGFAVFAEVTHEMESLLDLLRTDKLAVSSEVIDVLFQCLDALGSIKEQIAEGKGDAYDGEALVQALKAISQAGAPEAPKLTVETNDAPTVVEPVEAGSTPNDFQVAELPSEAISALEMAATDHPIYHAKFRLASDCCMKWVRAFMAMNVIAEQGELLVAIPDQERLEEEAFETDFEYYFQSSAKLSYLKTKFADIAEVAWFDAEPYAASPNLVASPQPEPATTNPAAAVVAEATPVANDEPASNEAKGAPKKAEPGQTVRVDVARLDDLMNLVGELVIDRTRVSQIGAELTAKYDYDAHIEALSETVSHISRITSDLQDQIMKARMLPIDTVFNRFPRVIRDLAHKVGKDIKLDISGGETELDRSVIEVIGDPLLHILRNSCDHGIEIPADRTAAGKSAHGTIKLSAKHEENHIVITIEDDGKGIDIERVKAKAISTGAISKDMAERMSDREALQLIFQSGLSTAEQVTDVSGRGVGMDIVRSNIQKLGGIIDMDTTLGVGTKFCLRLPLTLAIIRGLLVQVNEVVYVLPLGSVVETMLVDNATIQSVNKREVILIRGLTTPLVRLNSVFAGKGTSNVATIDQQYVVIVGLAEQRIGLVVDNLIGEQEVVIKSLSRYCGDSKGISGATILGDGNVALIVDVNGVVASSKS